MAWACLPPAPAADREAVAPRAARGTRGSLRRTLCSASNGASGSHSPSPLRFLTRRLSGLARTRNWDHGLPRSEAALTWNRFEV
jgi:hypothetical protein